MTGLKELETHDLEAMIMKKTSCKRRVGSQSLKNYPWIILWYCPRQPNIEGQSFFKVWSMVFAKRHSKVYTPLPGSLKKFVYCFLFVILLDVFLKMNNRNWSESDDFFTAAGGDSKNFVNVYHLLHFTILIPTAMLHTKNFTVGKLSARKQILGKTNINAFYAISGSILFFIKMILLCTLQIITILFYTKDKNFLTVLCQHVQVSLFF